MVATLPVPKKKLVTDVVTITPAVAQRWLEEMNPENRPVSWRHVNAYAEAMLRGEWHLNGEAIKMSDSRLIDGQHRLAAIVKAGIPVEMLVVYGLDDSTFTTVDTGKRRSFSDLLAIRGYRDRHALAVLVSLVTRHEVNHDLRKTHGVHFSYQQLEATLERHPGLPDMVAGAQQTRKRLGMMPGPASYLYWLFGLIDAQDRNAFFHQLQTGSGLATDSAVRLYRERLINDGSKGTGRLTNYDQIALGIKAWNHYRGGTPCRQLVWRSGGSQPETWPEPR